MSCSLRFRDESNGGGVTRVLVTRAREDVERLVYALEQADLEACVCPLIATEEVAGPRCDASGFAWVAFTSRAGVRFGLPRLSGSLPRVAAVGPGTAEALRASGIAVELVPQVHTQAGLVSALGPASGRVLFPGAEQAGSELIEALGAAHLIVYRTVELAPVQVPDADIAVLASASAARSLAKQRTDIPCVTIGPSTSREAYRCGLTTLCEASSSDLGGLIDAVRLGASRLL
ncbi:MAG: uroporphyrinogen-III synthase [Gaiellaceae bacterium]